MIYGFLFQHSGLLVMSDAHLHTENGKQLNVNFKYLIKFLYILTYLYNDKNITHFN